MTSYNLFWFETKLNKIKWNKTKKLQIKTKCRKTLKQNDHFDKANFKAEKASAKLQMPKNSTHLLYWFSAWLEKVWLLLYDVSVLQFSLCMTNLTCHTCVFSIQYILTSYDRTTLSEHSMINIFKSTNNDKRLKQKNK